MGNFYTDVIAQDPRFHATESVRDMALLEPVTRAAVQALIADAATQGIHLMVTETYRSRERQQVLFNQHLTKLQDVGVHHYGLAADFCKLIDGKASWDGDWTFMAPLCARHGLISGVDWGQPGVKPSFVDSDHVQRVTVAQQHQLFDGTWYPEG